MSPRSPFRLIWREAKFLLHTFLSVCLVRLRMMFDEYSLMLDQTHVQSFKFLNCEEDAGHVYLCVHSLFILFIGQHALWT